MMTLENRKRLYTFSTIILFIALTTILSARLYMHITEPEAQLFPDRFIANEERPMLIKCGLGTRNYFYLLNIYTGALYLDKTCNTSTDLIQADGYKRMYLHMLISRISAKKLSKFIESAMILSTHKMDEVVFADNIRALESYLPDLLQNQDVLMFDYQPNIGTKVIVNNEVTGVIKGKAFNDALLEAWIGDSAISEHFRQQLLSEVP